MANAYIRAQFAGAGEELLPWFDVVTGASPSDVLETNLDVLLQPDSRSLVVSANTLATCCEAIKMVCDQVKAMRDADVATVSFMGLASLIQQKIDTSTCTRAHLAELRWQLADSLNQHSGREPIVFAPPAKFGANVPLMPRGVA